MIYFVGCFLSFGVLATSTDRDTIMQTTSIPVCILKENMGAGVSG